MFGAGRSAMPARSPSLQNKTKDLDAKCRCLRRQISTSKLRHELEQSIGRLKSGEHMQCQSCGVGINIDTNRLANAADEIQKAIGKVPPEITIKFFH